MQKIEVIKYYKYVSVIKNHGKFLGVIINKPDVMSEAVKILTHYEVQKSNYS